ncbi:polygalacturonase [Capsaspora owczarzaki ATCC 30864]|uniref:Polygalacturonase n=1 Tax=Capsaspora owczarzaki (strain ATCC 30864) TaxID=595528 RepID=A0A0D2WK53_CAPO3|nr:polygalacturonase [Capsaspora owczarzaki ATCC 30864]KJE90565.1 polygalacturonase [Capsaspora owczarzaki ATCC 30864]|eukprot:XP_004364733.1 polygalacturonase [Capsaspora owczarzaki ATCC 30864]
MLQSAANWLFGAAIALSLLALVDAKPWPRAPASASYIDQYPSSTTPITLPVRSKSFNIVDYGAVGDNVTVNTAVFNKIVALVAANGDGEIYIPPGIFVSGTFNLTSHVTLRLASGAVLAGSPNFADHEIIPALPSYGRGRETESIFRYSSLVHGENLDDVVITSDNGQGVIDGNGMGWWAAHRASNLTYTRGHLVELMYTTDIMLVNVELRNSPFWTIHPYSSTNVLVSNVTINNPLDSPNTDGCDPDSCNQVVIQNCVFTVGDDCIAVKSGWDNPGIQYGVPTTDVVIRNMTMHTPTSAAIAIGSEMSGGVSNLLAQDIRAFNCSSGIRLKSARGRGGYLRNLTFDGVTLNDVKTALSINDFYGQHESIFYDPLAVPIIDSIFMSNIVGTAITIPGDFQGLFDAKITNVAISNVSLAVVGSGSYTCSYATGTQHAVVPVLCDAFARV